MEKLEFKSSEYWTFEDEINNRDKINELITAHEAEIKQRERVEKAIMQLADFMDLSLKLETVYNQISQVLKE